MARILIIDDDELQAIPMRDSIKNLLGHEAHIESDGVLGLKKAKEMKPDLILLDYSMPNMNGFEVCGEIRNDTSTKDIPILMLTGAKTTAEDKREGFNLGVDDFVVKTLYFR